MSLESSHGGSSLLDQSGDEALRLFKGESLRWVENLLSYPLDSTFWVATIIRCLGLIEVLLNDFLGLAVEREKPDTCARLLCSYENFQS